MPALQGCKPWLQERDGGASLRLSLARAGCGTSVSSIGSAVLWLPLSSSTWCAAGVREKQTCCFAPTLTYVLEGFCSERSRGSECRCLAVASQAGLPDNPREETHRVGALWCYRSRFGSFLEHFDLSEMSLSSTEDRF